jgi:hypothetical protein
MNLEEKKKRFKNELEKVEMKESELKKRKKDLKEKIKETENAILLAKGKRVISIFESNFGEITDENIEKLEMTLSEKNISNEIEKTEYTL